MPYPVVPAEAGIHAALQINEALRAWVPASAGMTKEADKSALPLCNRAFAREPTVLPSCAKHSESHPQTYPCRAGGMAKPRLFWQRLIVMRGESG